MESVQAQENTPMPETISSNPTTSETSPVPVQTETPVAPPQTEIPNMLIPTETNTPSEVPTETMISTETATEPAKNEISTSKNNGVENASVGLIMLARGGANAVTAGGYHTCSLMAGGKVLCWGRNLHGQLGNNSTTNTLVPVDVSGLSSDVSAITGGGEHTCALTTGGGVKCWGYNANGQLGNNSTTESHIPMNVTGLTSGINAIAAGGQHTCALTSDGGVKCWGRNDRGQLGNNSNTDSPIPVDVYGLTSGVSAVKAGSEHTCALTTGGGVKCWGNFYAGEEISERSESDIPVDIGDLSSGVIAITAGGSHNCALMSGGGVKCWGYNHWGQLGNNSTTNSNTTPVDVDGLASGVSAIAGGGGHTCALTTGGGVKCWGQNVYGQLGNNSTTDSPVPVVVNNLTSGVSAIAAGGVHTCALTTDGGIKCWGFNDSGQLGNNSTTNSPVPVNVDGLTGGANAITAGGYHTCSLMAGGKVLCWGRNLHGQLGINSTTNSYDVPVEVSGLSSGVSAITGGGEHTCALTTGGGVKCWGYNANGQLGNNTTSDSLVPVDVIGLTSGVNAVTAGGQHTCALTTDGGIRCWGRNDRGQLGNNTRTDSPIPVDVYGLTSGVSVVTTGSEHTCALMTGGGVKCWGYFYAGEGINAMGDSVIPVDVSGLSSDVSTIVAAGSGNCALMTVGGVKCWGYNHWGQLGNNSTTDSNSTPVDVDGLASGMSAVARGGNNQHACALTTGGGVKCWGQNIYGQLGNNSTTDSLVPVDVSGLTSGVSAIATGGVHTCVLMTIGGGIKCWGFNSSGQLGNKTTTDNHIPVDVTYSSLEIVVLVSPTGTISNSRPAFIWNAVPNAAQYTFSLDAGAISQIYTSTQAGCASGTGTCTVPSSSTLRNGDHTSIPSPKMDMRNRAFRV